MLNIPPDGCGQEYGQRAEITYHDILWILATHSGVLEAKSGPKLLFMCLS